MMIIAQLNLYFVLLLVHRSGTTKVRESEEEGKSVMTNVPELQLRYEERVQSDDNDKIRDLIVTCHLHGDDKFVPEMRMILCSNVILCEAQRDCFHRNETDAFCPTEAPDLKRYLKDFPHWLDNVMVECRDKSNPETKIIEYVLRVFRVPGIHNILSRDVQDADLIQLKYLNGTTPSEIYQNDTRCFYENSHVMVVAYAHPFFFPNPNNALGALCTWTLVYGNGTRRRLSGQQIPWQQDVVQFRALQGTVAVSCSIKWYNSTTEKLETFFPYKIIDSLRVTGAPEIDRSQTDKLTLTPHETHKLSCKFRGGDGNVTWTSQERAFTTRDSMTGYELYRNLLDDDVIESVIEVTYFRDEDTNWIPDVDNVTCTVENDLGSDSFTFLIQIGSGLGVIKSSVIILLGFVAALTFLWAFVVICKKWRNSAGSESEL